MLLPGVAFAGEFRVFVNSDLKDGYYFILFEGDISPLYSITVKNGSVISDGSSDKYGCLGYDCHRYMHEYAGKNVYIFINELQVLRVTPDGSKNVLTWYK